jgi:tripartite ATP-independent transporter DctP family solute receptor
MKTIRYQKFVAVTFVISFLFFISAGIAWSQEKPIVIKLGHHHSVGAVLDQIAHKFANIAKERSKGRLKIDVYPGAQLGQELEAAEGVHMGTLQMSIVSAVTYDHLASGLGMDMLPFFYSGWEDVFKIFNTNSPVGSVLEKRLLNKGVRILGWYAYGGRNMYFIDKNCKTMADMKGLKMRSMETELFINMYRAIGCRPTPITWGECYTALQTHVVDGMCSPPLAAKDMKFYEVLNYSLQTRHIWSTMITVINEKFFETLPNDLQKIIVEAGIQANDWANKRSKKDDRNAVQFFRKHGMVINDLSEEERDKFVEACQPIATDWAKEHNAVDIVMQARKLLKK